MSTPAPAPTLSPALRRLRIAGWTGATLLLLAPWVAMQLQVEGVNWGIEDFFFASILILGAGVALELAVRASGDPAYRLGAAFAVGAAFLTLWANAAVGFIGSENQPINRLFDAVIALGIVGAIAVRFRARGLAWVLLAMALAQLGVGLYALARGHFVPLVTLVFLALWLTAAALFRRAART